MISILRKLFYKKDLLKVYSHPRSGTHFLEAFLAKNFYAKKDLHIASVTWGHWSNRKRKEEGNPYGKLFGNHYFADRNQNSKPKIYIIRDGRAVAYSIWKTDNFIHKDLTGISFSDFLRTKLDWHGTPGTKATPKYTVLEHWYLHVQSWQELAANDSNLLLINYEDLKDAPYEQYERIHSKYFSRKKKLKIERIDTVEKPLGLLPNKGKKDEWQKVFSSKDQDFYNTIIPQNFKYPQI